MRLTQEGRLLDPENQADIVQIQNIVNPILKESGVEFCDRIPLEVKLSVINITETGKLVFDAKEVNKIFENVNWQNLTDLTPEIKLMVIKVAEDGSLVIDKEKVNEVFQEISSSNAALDDAIKDATLAQKLRWISVDSEGNLVSKIDSNKIEALFKNYPNTREWPPEHKLVFLKINEDGNLDFDKEKIIDYFINNFVPSKSNEDFDKAKEIGYFVELDKKRLSFNKIIPLLKPHPKLIKEFALNKEGIDAIFTKAGYGEFSEFFDKFSEWMMSVRETFIQTRSILVEPLEFKLSFLKVNEEGDLVVDKDSLTSDLEILKEKFEKSVLA